MMVLSHIHIDVFYQTCMTGYFIFPIRLCLAWYYVC